MSIQSTQNLRAQILAIEKETKQELFSELQKMLDKISSCGYSLFCNVEDDRVSLTSQNQFSMTLEAEELADLRDRFVS